MANGTIQLNHIKPITFVNARATTGTLLSITGYTYGLMFHYFLNVKNTSSVNEGSNIAAISWDSPNLGNAQTCTFYSANIAIGQMWGTGCTVRQAKGNYGANNSCNLYFTGLIGV